MDTRGISKISAANVASLVVKTGGGVVHQIQFQNGAGAINFPQVFDSATLPSNATVPLNLGPSVAASGYVTVDFGVHGIECANGITVAKSTTQATLTAGAADGQFSVIYR
jgi:hypothetical protein